MKYRKDILSVLLKWPYSLAYLIIFLIVFIVYETEITDIVKKSLKIEEKIVKIDTHDGFLIKTTGCRIPKLDPFDKAVMPYVNTPPTYICSIRRPLVESNYTAIFLDVEAFGEYNITDLESFTCCYKPFWRVDTKDSPLEHVYGFGKCINFVYETIIQYEFIKVVCKIHSTIIYKDYFSFVPPKRKDIKDRRADEKLNVLFVGLDAISRLNLYRTMPNFLKYLVNDLNAYEFVGYNKVADNTFPNLIPLFTGLSVEELTNVCWPTKLTRFDNCPFIWNNFSEKGYLTSFTEDAAWMGIFHYGKMGFGIQPTDYYWTTFSFMAEKMIGHSKFYNADLCLGVRLTYTVILDYFDKFIYTNLKKPFFGFFWENSLSHDNLNFPVMGDDTYRYFFEHLKNTTVLNKTILIVLSDHGIRWGGIRSTHQGQLEERLPFLFFIFPEWFKKKYSSAIANLNKNTRRLTTPYDIHETLKDLLDLSQIKSEKLKSRIDETTNRGISLFLPIPENRTCEMADISRHWCTCQISTTIPINDGIVKKIGQFLVSEMNKMLLGHWDCAQLSLRDILDARVLKTDDYAQTNSTIHDYIIMIRTLPGEGMFEGTVRLFSDANGVNMDSFNLIGTISRINLYGKQSECVADFHLKLYCYCLR